MGSRGHHQAELEARVQHHQLVADFGAAALDADDLDQLLQHAATLVAETLNVEYSAVFECATGGTDVHLRRGVGWSADQVGSAVTADESTMLGSVLTADGPVVVEELSDDPRFGASALLAATNATSGIGVPIGNADTPWGLIEGHTADARSFDDLHVSFVQSIANTLASAIDRFEHHAQLARTIDLMGHVEDIADVGGWEVYPSTGEVYWSDSIYSLLEVDPSTEPSLDEALDYYLPEDRPIVSDAIDDALDTGEPFDIEARIRATDGTVKWLNIIGTSVSDDDRSSLRGAIQDVTDRKTRERDLMQYRAVTEAANDVIVTIDRTSTIQTINATVDDVFGYDPDDLVGESLTVLMSDEHARQHQAALEQYIESGEETVDWSYLEMTGIHADGSELPLALSFSEVEHDGEPFFTGVIRDITQRKQYERELEESHERLEQFAVAVSHDLKEPLGTISSYLQLLERRYQGRLGQDGEEFIDFAVGAAERMRDMLDGLVSTYARRDDKDHRFEVVDLNEVFEAVEADLEQKLTASDASVTVDDLPRVEGDPNQLKQLFANLLDNAVKYAGSAPPEVTVTATRQEAAWEIAVRDEGIGIESYAIDSVFDVFYRVHESDEYAGTGIGLALCKRIVEQHGGDIWVDSEPGAGSTFVFSLPKGPG